MNRAGSWAAPVRFPTGRDRATRRVEVDVSWRVALALLLAVPLSAALAPLPTRLSTPPSPVMTWADGRTAHVRLAPDDRWRMATDPDRLDPAYLPALLALEDRRFGWHPGTDPAAVLRATATNLWRGRVVSGASTLTLQLVRMLEPRPRTLPSKLIETWRALGLTLRLTRDERLAAYLAFVPYGRNLEGVEAASWAMFGHGPEVLSADEIATLLAVPQDPTGRHPRADHVAALHAARHEVAARLLAADALPTEGDDAEALAAIDAAAVPDRLQPFPRAAPHLAHTLPLAARTTTTLRADIQQTAERIVARYRGPRAAQGIADIAVVIVDRPTASVAGLIGGFVWDPDVRGSQIASFDVPRSPGSTLKPWIHALAIDRGLTLPEQLVPDVPMAWPGYRPRNYDGTHSGVIRLEAALSRSLNVPYVGLLQQLGVEALLGTLAQAGVSSLNPSPDHYGLSAAVGGVELTPRELAGLYLTLADNGAARPLRLHPDQPVAAGLSLVSPGAAWLTRRALRLRDRPDFPTRKDLSALPPEIAWKTGTSQGHRDAWAVGWDDTHVITVWLGNLDQRPSPHLVGADAAGEILFDLLETLGNHHAPAADPAPPDLAPLTVCALSGHRPNPACPHTVEVLAPRAASPTTPCPYHELVEVDLATGLSVLPGCRAGPTTTLPALRWPPAVRRWLADRGGDLPERPALHPACPARAEEPPRLRAPAPGDTILLVPGRPAEAQQIPLEADAGPADGLIAWFLDGSFLGQTGPHERLWWTPTPGAHTLTAVDSAGRAARHTVRVEARDAIQPPSVPESPRSIQPETPEIP